MLARYGEINDGALSTYARGAKRSLQTVLVLTLVVLLLPSPGRWRWPPGGQAPGAYDKAHQRPGRKRPLL
jgi:hypothetical protein